MMTLNKESFKVITFSSSIANSDGKPVPGTSRVHNLLFNITQISVEEVNELINNDAWELDDRVIDIPTCILNNLKDKK